VATERFIENNVIRNRGQLGYADSVYIRRCRAGRGFGIVDIMLIPLRGPHRLVLIEAKQSLSVDAPSKVVGQLLLYYAGVLQFGLRGVRHLRNFATAHIHSARSTRPKMLKSLTGGVTPADEAWREMRKGRRLKPSQIGLYVALDAEPSPGLISALSVLATHHGLRVGVISVLGRDKIDVWYPAKPAE
jgi:hypothetical protein